MGASVRRARGCYGPLRSDHNFGAVSAPVDDVWIGLHDAIDELKSALAHVEPLLTPQLAAAFLDAFAELVRETQHGVAVTHPRALAVCRGTV